MTVRIDVDQRRALAARRQRLVTTGRAQRSIDEVVEALALLHSTDPVTPYLSLHARSDASVADIDTALYDGPLVRFTTLRRTVFVMDHDAARAAHGAFNTALVSKLRHQLIRWLEATPEAGDDPAGFLADTEREVLDRLVTAGAATGSELSDAVAALRTSIDPQPGASYSRPLRITSKVLELLGAELRIVRGRPTGADYTSGAWRWRAATEAERALAGARPDDALVRLLERYLRSFAPATVTDMAWWTGLPKRAIRAALATLDAAAVDLGTDEVGFALADDDLDAAPPPGDEVTLLPGLDATTMGWKQRAWYVDDDASAGIFDRNGNAGPTVWHSGRVVGVWTQRADGSVVWESTTPLESAVRDRAEVECARSAAWLGGVRVAWRYPTALTKQLIG